MDIETVQKTGGRIGVIFKESISNEDLLNLPLRYFDKEIRIIDTEEQLEQIYSYLSRQDMLGFDTETRPSFKKGQINKVALLQLSTNDRAYIFRLQKLGLPNKLKRILSNPNIVKSGVAIRDDIKALRNLSEFNPLGFVELQDMARQLKIENFSLKKLCGIALGFRISKAQQLSNWEAELLSDPQLQYAATDAWVSLGIYQKFAHFLDELE